MKADSDKALTDVEKQAANHVKEVQQTTVNLQTEVAEKSAEVSKLQSEYGPSTSFDHSATCTEPRSEGKDVIDCKNTSHIADLLSSRSLSRRVERSLSQLNENSLLRLHAWKLFTLPAYLKRTNLNQRSRLCWLRVRQTRRKRWQNSTEYNRRVCMDHSMSTSH